MTYNITTTKEDFFKKYLYIINGTLKLSEKEILILAEFLKYTLEYSKDPELIFSSSIRKKIQNTLKISSANLNNYIQYLKNKKVIVETNGLLTIAKIIVPTIKENNYEVTFKFNING
jgi:hypothetical protein